MASCFLVAIGEAFWYKTQLFFWQDSSIYRECPRLRGFSREIRVL